MISFLNRLFTPVPASRMGLLIQLRIRFIQALAVLAVAIGLAVLVTLLINQEYGTGTVFAVFFIGFSMAIYMLASRAYVILATACLLALFIITLVDFNIAIYLMSMLIVLSSAILLNFPLFFVVNALTLVYYIVNMVSVISSAPTFAVVFQEISLLLSLIAAGLTTRYFIYVSQGFIDQSRRSASLLQATAEIGHELSQYLEMDELFKESVNLIRDRFGFYHVQIFMLDESRTNAILVASTGEAGRRLLMRQHSLGVGSNSVIGVVTGRAESLIAVSGVPGTMHRFNELLPETKAELAVPIMDGEKVIGALDVQSRWANAFEESDVRALQSLANLLSGAIRNAQLFEAQSQSVKEQQRLLLDSEANLREIQRLNQQLTRTGWDQYLKDKRDSFGVTVADEKLIMDGSWSESLMEAALKQRPVAKQVDDTPVVAVPVILRNEVIGAIEVEPSRELSPAETLEMLEAVAQRLASGLENARLFEEAQASTAREQDINRIVSQYQAVTTVDDLLQITLRELSQTLGAERGAIRLTSGHQGDSLNGNTGQ
jgi:GAF domain-containing protein